MERKYSYFSSKTYDVFEIRFQKAYNFNNLHFKNLEKYFDGRSLKSRELRVADACNIKDRQRLLDLGTSTVILDGIDVNEISFEQIRRCLMRCFRGLDNKRNM